MNFGEAHITVAGPGLMNLYCGRYKCLMLFVFPHIKVLGVRLGILCDYLCCGTRYGKPLWTLSRTGGVHICDSRETFLEFQ